MSTAGDPIADDEILLRRVLKDQLGTRGEFTPTADDDDGLSLYRARLVSAAMVRRAARRPPEDYVVVRIRASELKGINLNVIAAEDEDLPGHCIIPELSLPSYSANKSHWRPVQKKLMELRTVVPDSEYQ